VCGKETGKEDRESQTTEREGGKQRKKRGNTARKAPPPDHLSSQHALAQDLAKRKRKKVKMYILR
jgi:hypothetical protein